MDFTLNLRIAWKSWQSMKYPPLTLDGIATQFVRGQATKRAEVPPAEVLVSLPAGWNALCQGEPAWFLSNAGARRAYNWGRSRAPRKDCRRRTYTNDLDQESIARLPRGAIVWVYDARRYDLDSSSPHRAAPPA